MYELMSTLAKRPADAEVCVIADGLLSSVISKVDESLSDERFITLSINNPKFDSEDL